VLLIFGAGMFLHSAIAAAIPPEVKKAVTFIFPADAQGNILRDAKTNIPSPYGTGFFVTVANEPPRVGGYGYLVTAKHVLKAPDGKDFSRIFLRLNKLKGDAEYVALDLVQDGRSVVYTHPDPTVDIAVVPAFPNGSVYDFKTVPADLLTGKSVSELNISERGRKFSLLACLPAMLVTTGIIQSSDSDG
jgi:hypothetical protein